MYCDEVPLRLARDAAKGVTFLQFQEKVCMVVSSKEAVLEIGNIDYT